MIDVTTLVRELNIGLDFAERIEPLLATFDPPVAGMLLAALKGARSIEASLGIAPNPQGFAALAAVAVTRHNTPGQENSPVLAG